MAEIAFQGVSELGSQVEVDKAIAELPQVTSQSSSANQTPDSLATCSSKDSAINGRHCQSVNATATIVRAANDSGGGSAPPASINALSSELIYHIFHYLTPVNSVCLGLTCGRFYQVHYISHGKVHLATIDNDSHDITLSESGPRLAERLTSWMPYGYRLWTQCLAENLKYSPPGRLRREVEARMAWLYAKEDRLAEELDKVQHDLQTNNNLLAYLPF